MALTSQQVRQQFLDFFASKGHAIVDSSPVVPLDDPTLMFANAGMNQFKDVFLATGSRPYTRAADTQKCIRAGGKHNDLDDVGQDTYHHTFFEMLGNWSFGDYFKKEAIEWAWELLTGVWGIDKTRLHATYFEGDAAEGLEPDSEAAELWRTVTDILPENIHPGNKKDNFWEMGDTGPCGPCSEVHIDLTPDKSGHSLVNAGDARVIEIWNLVFIQFNRSAGGLSPLPAKHVDTGMGFERITAVLQGKLSNYDTDVFKPLFDAIRQRTGAPAYTGLLPGAEGVDPVQLMIDICYRVIADHVRCVTFALTDGAFPGNDGRGYVLRRILRRAVRYGRQYLNMNEPFLVDLVDPLVAQMGEHFPELRANHGGKNVDHVKELIRDEEESFGRTLDRGIKLFDEAAEYAKTHHHGKISGQDAFKLHDTYGFPIDLTEQMAEERTLTVDIGEYERLMEEARKRARAAGGSDEDLFAGLTPDDQAKFGPCDESPKYDPSLRCTASVQTLIAPEAQNRGVAEAGDRVVFATDCTCFYAEQGGQVSDTGKLVTEGGTKVRVLAVRREGDLIQHAGKVLEGTLRAGEACTLSVDPERRLTMKNHTSTHLLNWALREVLGDHVQQKGSLVDHEKTRFDFSHTKAMTNEELARVEQLVNEQIEADHPVYVKEVDQAAAREINTLRAVFGEKYPDRVRVVSVGADIDAMLSNPDDPGWMKSAVEFCGGTHLERSGEAERFVLTTEEAVAKGIRRVVGITGPAAIAAEDRGQKLQARVEALIQQAAGDTVDPEQAAAQLADLQREINEAEMPIRVRNELRDRLTELQKAIKKQEKAAASASGEAVQDAVAALFEAGPEIAGVKVVVGEVPEAQADALRSAIDWVRNKTEQSVVLLVSAGDEGKVTLIAGMSKSVVKQGVKAGDLIKELAPLVGGRGGGRPDMAQGGGTDAAGIPAALERANAWLTEKLNS
jgi:alanyl-tRNA synthetase